MDLLKIAEREKYADVFDMFCTNSFLPKITFPTRFAKHSCSLIDQIYYKPYTSSGTANTVTAGIILSTISDHFPSFISLNIKRTSPKIPKFVTISRYTSEAVENIRGDLIAEHISQKICPTHENNPNSMYDIFQNCITTIKQKHMPCISVKFKKHKHKLSNWISYGILHSIKFRDKLYKQLKTTHVDTPEYLRLKTNLDNYNKVLKQSIRAAKQAHYYDICNEHRNDIQKTWTSIKNVLNQGKGNDKFPNVFLIENKLCSDKELIANTFNEYFTQIGPRLAANIDVANKRSYESYLGNPCEGEFNFTRTSEEIMEIISKMKPKSSSGLDNISCRLMKDISDIIATPLTLLINQSLQSGIFPDKLKIAKVVPIFKAGKDNIDSYVQYGFRKSHSTELAALELIDSIYKKLDQGKTPIAIFLDLSKAFDTIDHKILINKLHHCGCRNISLNWFKSYLTERSQYVVINDTISKTLRITTGVPQGSVLGPLLFLIYMNDLSRATDKFKYILFADDTNLFSNTCSFKNNSSQNNIDQISLNINVELGKISDWMSANKLSLNTSKSKFIIFSYRQKKMGQNKIPTLTINGTPIERKR